MELLYFDHVALARKSLLASAKREMIVMMITTGMLPPSVSGLLARSLKEFPAVTIYVWRSMMS
jgi:hypothetical protein